MTRALQTRINAHFAQRHDYLPLDFQASTSVFDSTARQFREEISAEIVGKNVDENAIDDPRSLYQIPPLRYDSVDPELPLLKYDYPQQVSVFGKLPKRAIQIPKYTGALLRRILCTVLSVRTPTVFIYWLKLKQKICA